MFWHVINLHVVMEATELNVCRKVSLEAEIFLH